MRGWLALALQTMGNNEVRLLPFEVASSFKEEAALSAAEPKEAPKMAAVSLSRFVAARFVAVGMRTQLQVFVKDRELGFFEGGHAQRCESLLLHLSYQQRYRCGSKFEEEQ